LRHRVGEFAGGFPLVCLAGRHNANPSSRRSIDAPAAFLYAGAIVSKGERETTAPDEQVDPNWRRGLYAIWVAELLAIAGFGSVTPIVPFFIQELGVTDPAQLRIWVGLVQTSGSVTLAVFSPIWGRLADSYGRRIMFLRALFGGALTMTLMGLSSQVWQLVLFRGLGGIFTGTVAAANVLVASSVPAEHRGSSLGLLQMAIMTGSALGPLTGGTLGDLFGYRVAFFATAALFLAGAAVVLLFVRERFRPPLASGRFLSRLVPDLSVLTESREVFSLLLVMAAIQLAGSVVAPILPLFIQHLETGGEMIGSKTGLVIGASAFAGAIAAGTIGKASDRFGYKRTLTTCVVAAALAYVPLVFVTATWQLMILRIAAGAFLGGTAPAVNALIASKADPAKQGAVFGLAHSMNAVGFATGPALGALVAAAWGFSPVFLTTAVILGAAAVMTSAVVRPVRGAAGSPRGR
jgi:DHA1 family multidrug resistance protein-like MFS transporter